MVAPVGFVRFTLKVSSPSTVRSPFTGMLTVAVVAPAGMVTVPVAGVRSVPSVLTFAVA